MASKGNVQQAEKLALAFDAFTEMSSQLEHSYRELEHQVAHLNVQLEEARRDRLQQLREKERLADRLSRLLAALPAGVVVLDEAGEIQDSNPWASQFFGVPLDRGVWADVLQQSSARSSAGHNEYTFDDGRRIVVTEKSLPEKEGKIVLFTDITEIRDLEKQLARKTRLTEMGETTARLAHQIRTPLAAARLYVSQLSRDKVSEQARQRYADKIAARLTDLESLVNDMLAFARGSQESQAAISCTSILNETLQAVQHRLKGGQRVTVDSCSGVISLRGNRHAILGALQNLTNNALDAAGDRARIRLSAFRSGTNHIVMEVKDNGPGVADDVLEKIFEPFFTTRPSGTGLGLAVVQSVARAHGGDCWVKSKVGKGATFYFSLAIGEEPQIKNRLLTNAPTERECVGAN